MNRRDFLISGLASLGLPSLGSLPVEGVDTNQRNNDQTNVTLRIAPISLEIGPGKTIKTVGYNGSAPGPILRFREGKAVTVDVFNDTDVADRLLAQVAEIDKIFWDTKK